MTGAILGAAGIAAASTVASGIMSSKAQASANETNVDMMREQMAYQTSEREAVQEYNTPANQRARFEAAGINPYMALGNISSGTSEMQSGVTPAQIQPNTGLAEMLQGLGMIPNQALQLQQSAENIQATQEANKQARIETLYKGQQKLLELQRAKAEIEEKWSNVAKGSAEYDNYRSQGRMLDRQIRMLDGELRYQSDYLSSRNKRERETAELTHWQARKEMFESEIKEIESQYASQLNQATLSSIKSAAAANFASAYASYQSGHLSKEQAATEFAQRVLKSQGLRLDNEQKEKAMGYIMEMYQTGIELNRQDIRQKKQDVENPFRYFGSAIVGAGLGNAGAALNAPKAIKGFGR